MAKGHEGWVAIVPETKGWGSSVFAAGNYLFADSETLSISKEFTERADKITYGRALKPSNRVNGPQKPGGGIQFQFRSDDVLPTLMSHYQMYKGSSQGGTATGTVVYDLVPSKSEPNWTGSAFGNGTYGAAAGDMFTVGVIKKFFDTTQNGGTNSMWFKSCIADSLEFNLTASDDAKMTANFKAYDVDAGTALGASLNPSNASIGSYSTKPSFIAWVGTLLFAGQSLDITTISFTSANNTEDRSIIGRKNPSKYPLGRVSVKGKIDLDIPKDGLKWMGSQLADGTFAVSGTLYNSVNDSVIFAMPMCKYESFEMNLAGGNSESTFSIPFVAYESEDGGTAPIKWTVRTTGYGTVFDHI